MNYLLDTNVLRDVCRPQPEPRVLAWLDQVDEDRVRLSVITVAELARGIALLAAGRRKLALAEWLEQDLKQRFGDRLLLIDGVTALIWGELMGEASRAGRHLVAMDGWIAALARQHDLVLVTRNVKDFTGLGLEILDPWSLEIPKQPQGPGL